MNLSGKAVQSFVAKNRGLFINKDPAIEKPKTLKEIVKNHFIIAHDDL